MNAQATYISYYSSASSVTSFLFLLHLLPLFSSLPSPGAPWAFPGPGFIQYKRLSYQQLDARDFIAEEKMGLRGERGWSELPTGQKNSHTVW